ncbi:MAG: XRE family transcriptional regulator [Bacteroidales bacterium]|nr:XRE family transcriptional regulator [Lentimicrobiaceae bacterium]MBQ2852904.1 XRE family transcriptional regulator [Bacteroidales bacterium]
MRSEIHIGNIIKEELRRQKRTNQWFAEQLSINIRTVNKIFLKQIIDTEQLFMISHVLEKDLFKLYSEKLELE